jgi:SynChlorMet cassette protein ScmC
LTKRSYVLKFNKRCTWNLVGTKRTMVWLDGLAAAMGLQPSYLGNYPSIRYILGPGTRETGQPNIVEPDLDSFPKLKKDLLQASSLTSLRLWTDPETHDFVCELNDASPELAKTQILLSLNPVYESIMRCCGIPLHAALAEHSGRAFLLAGNHGVGKSTCCLRLPSSWNALCDDEAVVLHGRRGYYAHPIPTWSVYLSQVSHPRLDVSRRLPLSSLFFLEKARDVEIVQMGQGEAALRILKSSKEVWLKRMNAFDRLAKRSLRTRILENSCKLARQVPAYLLRVSATGEFWKAIESLIDRDANEMQVPEESRQILS